MSEPYLDNDDTERIVVGDYYATTRWLEARDFRTTMLHAAVIAIPVGLIVADASGRVLYLVKTSDVLTYLTDIGILQCNGVQA